MKNRLISAVTAAVISVCSVASAVIPAFAEDNSAKNLLVLGDSIATGYNVTGNVNLNYGQIVADYYGCTAVNKAENGLTTDGLITKLTSDSDVKSAASTASVILVSIGGNDLLGATKTAAGELIAKWCANPSDTYFYGKTNLDYMSALKVIQGVTDEKQQQSYASDLFAAINSATSAQVTASAPKLTQIRSLISSVNPDAEVVFQTIYNPFAVSESTINLMSLQYSQSYVTAYNQLNSIARIAISRYNNNISKLSNVKIADIYDAFTENNTDSQLNNDSKGYAHALTGILASGDKRDIHPNQLGHLAIAAKVIQTIGNIKLDDTSLYKTYIALPELQRDALPLEVRNSIETATTVKKGDINDDRAIDAIDASAALTYYSAIQGGTTAKNYSDVRKTAADADNNGAIDAGDASIILTHYASVQTGGKGIL